jgi:O-antigen ligase
VNNDPMLVPTVAFWILASLTFFLPIRWSLVFYLLLVQIDLSAVGNFSTDSLGIQNAIKVIIIPTILLIKLRKEIHFDKSARKYFVPWILFSSYACIALFWSPYRISALKMNGYLYAYTILFVVFVTTWQQEWLNKYKLMFVVWVTLAAGIIQTYFLGNAFGSDEFQSRFTTFTGAQSLAPFLLCMMVLLLFRERASFFTFLTATGAAIGVLLTGSRSVFLGMVWVLLIYGIYSAVRSAKTVRIGMILGRMMILGAAMAVIILVVVEWLPNNRLNEMLTAAVEKNATVDDVGTFGWRFSLYQRTLDELIHRSLPRLLVGSGTSSGADLVLDGGFFNEDNVDPNRAIHDEFLRTTYEWGLLGLAPFVLFLVRILKLDLRQVSKNASPQAWAFLAIVVPFFISLSVENFLADSGSPGGVGYNLVLTSMMALVVSRSEENESSPAQQTPGAIPATSQSIWIMPENREADEI